MQNSIYPPPKKLKTLKKSLSISQRPYLQLTSNHSDLFHEALLRFCAHCPYDLQISFAQIAADQILISVILSKKKSNSEAYKITSSDAGLVLSAYTETGLYWSQHLHLHMTLPPQPFRPVIQCYFYRVLFLKLLCRF